VVNEKQIEEGIVNFLEFIGEDPGRVGIKGTPGRMVRMCRDIFRGYNESLRPDITVFPNEERYKGMIIDVGYFFSFCEHHIIPFWGDYFYGYIPNQLIVGASKIARIIDFYSAKIQLQERLCIEVVSCLEEKIKPLGSILIMRGRHLCKEMRGVRKYNSPFETIEVRGYFDENKDGCKDEFIARIGSRM